MKLIKLYREVVITAEEFLSLTAPIIIPISKEVFEYIKGLIYTREKIRRIESQNFKSFQNLETSGISSNFSQ